MTESVSLFPLRQVRMTKSPLNEPELGRTEHFPFSIVRTYPIQAKVVSLVLLFDERKCSGERIEIVDPSVDFCSLRFLTGEDANDRTQAALVPGGKFVGRSQAASTALTCMRTGLCLRGRSVTSLHALHDLCFCAPMSDVCDLCSYALAGDPRADARIYCFEELAGNETETFLLWHFSGVRVEFWRDCGGVDGEAAFVFDNRGHFQSRCADLPVGMSHVRLIRH